eukprot:jgi/Mesvir1/28954/Mv17732-RA.2
MMADAPLPFEVPNQALPPAPRRLFPVAGSETPLFPLGTKQPALLTASPAEDADRNKQKHHHSKKKKKKHRKGRRKGDGSSNSSGTSSSEESREEERRKRRKAESRELAKMAAASVDRADVAERLPENLLPGLAPTQGAQKEYYFDTKGDRDNLVFGCLYRMNVAKYKRYQTPFLLELERRQGRFQLPRVLGFLEVEQDGIRQKKSKEARYFAGKFVGREHDQRLKRVVLAPSDIPQLKGPREAAQGGPGAGGEFIPLMPEGDETASERAYKRREEAEEGQVAEEGQSYEEMMLEKTKYFNQMTREHPENAATWLEFARFEEERMHRLAPQRSIMAHMWERKLAILTQAVRLHPLHEELVLTRLDTCGRLMEPDKLEAQWQEALTRLPYSVRLWREYLRIKRSLFSSFSVSAVRSIFARAVGALVAERDKRKHVAQRGEAAASGHVLDEVAQVERCILDVLMDSCYFEREANHTEVAIGRLQALMEYTIFALDGPMTAKESNKRRLFEAFWESGQPRFGEPGARGWRVWLQNAGKVAGPDLMPAPASRPTSQATDSHGSVPSQQAMSPFTACGSQASLARDVAQGQAASRPQGLSHAGPLAGPGEDRGMDNAGRRSSAACSVEEARDPSAAPAAGPMDDGPPETGGQVWPGSNAGRLAAETAQANGRAAAGGELPSPRGEGKIGELPNARGEEGGPGTDGSSHGGDHEDADGEDAGGGSPGAEEEGEERAGAGGSDDEAKWLEEAMAEVRAKLQVDPEMGTMVTPEVLAKWVEVESSRSFQEWAPLRPGRAGAEGAPGGTQGAGDGGDGGEDDEERLQRIVFFDDVKDFLVSLQDLEVRKDLLYRFFQFCGAQGPQGPDVVGQPCWFSSNARQARDRLGWCEAAQGVERRQLEVSCGSMPSDGTEPPPDNVPLVKGTPWLLQEPGRTAFVQEAILAAVDAFPEESPYLWSVLLATERHRGGQAAGADARKMAKNLLKDRRQDLPLWVEFAHLEAQGGNLGGARKVLDNLLGSLPTLPPAQTTGPSQGDAASLAAASSATQLETVTSICLSYARMEMGTGGQAERAVHLLTWLGERAGRFSPLPSPLPPVAHTRLLRAQQGLRLQMAAARPAAAASVLRGRQQLPGYGRPLSCSVPEQLWLSSVTSVAYLELLALGGLPAALRVMEEGLALWSGGEAGMAAESDGGVAAGMELEASLQHERMWAAYMELVTGADAALQGSHHGAATLRSQAVVDAATGSGSSTRPKHAALTKGLSPATIRRTYLTSLQTLPSSPWLLGGMIQAEVHSHIHNRLRRYFDAVCGRHPSLSGCSRCTRSCACRVPRTASATCSKGHWRRRRWTPASCSGAPTLRTRPRCSGLRRPNGSSIALCTSARGPRSCGWTAFAPSGAPWSPRSCRS